MGDPARGAVVPGREDPVLAREHATHARPRAGRASRHGPGDLEEVVIPAGSRNAVYYANSANSVCIIVNVSPTLHIRQSLNRRPASRGLLKSWPAELRGVRPHPDWSNIRSS
jgi:hypothetical protein